MAYKCRRQKWAPGRRDSAKRVINYLFEAGRSGGSACFFEAGVEMGDVSNLALSRVREIP